MNYNNLTFTDSDGNSSTWSGAARSQQVQRYLSYYNNQQNGGRYNYVGLDTLNLTTQTGYWIYAQVPGMITVPGEGSNSSASYRWDELMFRNSTGTELNVTSALGAGWIAGNLDNGELLWFWNPLGGPYSKGAWESLPGDYEIQIIAPWQGYFVWSYYDNITMLRED